MQKISSETKSTIVLSITKNEEKPKPKPKETK